MSANKIKVSVSMSPDMHEWLKTEAEHETQESGEDVSVSRLVVRAVRTMQASLKESEESSQNSSSKASNVSTDISAKIVKGSESSAGGRSTAPRKTSRKAG